MPADSPGRRRLKRLLHRLLPEGQYRRVQALAMARDIRRGAWWEPELELLPLAVRPGDTVLDIGANYGLYSYHLSRAVGPGGRVLAFEPLPFTSGALRLVRRLLRLRNVEVVPLGCSDRSGTATFRVPVQGSGAISAGQAHLAPRDDDREGRDRHAGWAEWADVRCEVVALDDYLPEIGELSFLKCDIEGGELLAFRGARDTIARHRPTVVCEINPWFLDGFGFRLEELVGFFDDLGYSLYRYDDSATPAALRPVRPEEVVEDNYVFVHPARRPALATLELDA